MLRFFRRIINSKAGMVVTFVVLGIIALAFAATDITGLGSPTGAGVTGGNVATVGGESIGEAELRTQAASEMESYRQQQPTLDMASYIQQGGLDGTLDRLVTGLAFLKFGEDHGMVVSKRSIDGEIASIPALQGPTGKFDQTLYERILAERKLTDAGIRADIERELTQRRLTAPTIGAAQMPQQIVLPYASLLLEKRTGQIAFIPAGAVKTGPAPSDADIQTYYGRNLSRYTVPQRRVVRYALVTPAQVNGTPTEAEIVKSYNDDRANYAPRQTRTITQVVVLDQAGATAIAAKVRAGQSVADAARAAGLEASTKAKVEKSDYAAQSSAAAADAAFSAASGAIVGPVRGATGWIVARVDAIEQVPAKTLDQARADIVAALTKQKTADAMGAIHDKLDDAIAGKATFDELVSDGKLAAITTPPLLANGINPDAPTTKPDPAMTPILAAAFGAEEGDSPQLVQIGEDGRFALVGVGRIVPAAPRPLAQIRAQVLADVTADRAQQAARKVASEAVARLNKGAPLAQVLQQTGLALPAPRPLSIARAQIAQRQGVEPALALLFSMAPNTSKMLEAPDNAGWLIVKLDAIQPGNAAGNAGILAATRNDLGRSIGREYVEQFARAVRADVKAKTDPAAVARVKAALLGQSGN
ncbi:peptidylprolyl isomerase [Sphingomonas sp. Leaf17]|uniref:peptidylprolyl isomerase n=1 Tax=Sphingomonas sp. Leaf17 TaxID=1735683 RepID=UPI0007022D17|nr:peptidylprolyl isomerase [Sphingomonas sp. Leaf17]KQM65101.1 peptidylprolyl isomerase [Sphingomonas sp. Leaf17]